MLGTLGLLVHVPWAIGRYFPGEGRVPLLIMVAGVGRVPIEGAFTPRREEPAEQAQPEAA